MKDITFADVLRTSKEKWEAIVENDGQDINHVELENILEGLSSVSNTCSMCYFVIELNRGDCNDCIYQYSVCRKLYQEWVVNQTLPNAYKVLGAITKANNRKCTQNMLNNI